MAQARLVPSRPLGRAVFPSVDAVVAVARPTDPVLCLRPAALAAAAQRFVDSFPGRRIFYSILLTPMMVVPAVAGYMFYMLFQSNGPINQILSFLSNSSVELGFWRSLRTRRDNNAEA